MSGYMTFWSKEHIRDMKKAGDIGPLTVIYGGRHSKEPSLKKIKVGDVIFPVSLENNKLIVMARLQVERLEDAFEYQLREIGYPCGAIIPEGTLVISDELEVDYKLFCRDLYKKTWERYFAEY